MYTDMFGKKRMKTALHVHTNRSDGGLSPQEAIRYFKERGFDAVALTDHWVWHEGGEMDGVQILSGCEYNSPHGDTASGVFHILGIGAPCEPQVQDRADAQCYVDAIRQAGGIAILAHPAWSLNTVEQVKELEGICGTEIYNTVSGVHASNRPDSSAIVDLLANAGLCFPLIAADDCHYYDNDAAVSYIMIDVSDGKTSQADLTQKIAQGAFYATQGPEIHLSVEGSKAVVRCSPAVKISFYSQTAWSADRNAYGDGMTQAQYQLKPFEKWIRAEVTDALGNRAWSNVISL